MVNLTIIFSNFVYLYKYGTMLKINVYTKGRYDGCIISLYLITKYFLSETVVHNMQLFRYIKLSEKHVHHIFFFAPDFVLCSNEIE